MVDNIKVNKPLASVSSAKSVRPVGHRQDDNRRNLFKEIFKNRRKKKKRDDPMLVTISERGAAAGKSKHSRHALTSKKAKASLQKKIIDIRV